MASIYRDLRMIDVSSLVVILLLFTCNMCVPIRVPPSWDEPLSTMETKVRPRYPKPVAPATTPLLKITSVTHNGWSPFPTSVTTHHRFFYHSKARPPPTSPALSQRAPPHTRKPPLPMHKQQLYPNSPAFLHLPPLIDIDDDDNDEKVVTKKKPKQKTRYKYDDDFEDADHDNDESDGFHSPRKGRKRPRKRHNQESLSPPPPGYEVYENGLKLFDRLALKFGPSQSDDEATRETHFDQQHQQPTTTRRYKRKRRPTTNAENFTPSQTYAQVRHSERVIRMPHPAHDEPRLRELHKDTTIRTVYSEEGFEDSAYDHGHRDREADEDERFTYRITQHHNRSRRHVSVEQYPYYHLPADQLHPDSPLRYSEGNVPQKSGPELAFYEQRAQLFPCPDTDDIDLAVENVHNTTSPRMNGSLGAKIDCYKRQLFGDSPLDNPLFENDIDDSEVEEGGDDEYDEDYPSAQNETFNSTGVASVDDQPVAQPLVLRTKLYKIRGYSKKRGSSRPRKTKRRKRRRRPSKPSKPSSIVPGTSVSHYRNLVDARDQMTVFADVLNIIKNSSRDLSAAHSNVYTSANLYRHQPARQEYTDSYFISTTDSPLLIRQSSTSTTTRKPYRGTAKYRPTKYEQLYEDLLSGDIFFDSMKLGPKNHRTSKQDYDIVSGPDVMSTTATGNEVEMVEGMMAPPSSAVAATNTFYVLGMRPPPPKLRARLRFRRRRQHHVRLRRSVVMRPAYAELVRNRNRPIDAPDSDESTMTRPDGEDDDDDDYVPHRPKNYHYDEKLKRIVYDRRPVDDDEEESDEEEEEEEYAIPATTSTRKPLPSKRKKMTTTTLPPPVTDPAAVNIFLDLVHNLKMHPQYHDIPDKPPPNSSTTPKSANTPSPEFLMFLNTFKMGDGMAKMLQKNGTIVMDSSFREDRTSTTRPTTTTTIMSRMSTIKSFSPRTSIDYSKYKTIERPHTAVTRHNYSSRYSSEQQPAPQLDDAVQEVTTPRISSTTTKSPGIRVRHKSRRTTTSSTTTPRSISTMQLNRDGDVEVDRTLRPKTRRVYPRRKPTRIRLSTTTTTYRPKTLVRRRQPSMHDTGTTVLVVQESSLVPKRVWRTTAKTVNRENRSLPRDINRLEESVEKHVEQQQQLQHLAGNENQPFDSSADHVISGEHNGEQLYFYASI